MKLLTCLVVFGLMVMAPWSQASPFNTFDISVLPDLADPTESAQAKIETLTENLNALEKRVNDSLSSGNAQSEGSMDKMESRMTELQELFEGSRGEETDSATKDEVEQVVNRLETLEESVSSVASVKETLAELQEKVHADSEKNKELENRLDSAENSLSAVSSVQQVLGDLQEKVNADAKTNENQVSRLDTLESKVEAVQSLKNSVGDLEANFNADSKKKERDIEELKAAKTETSQQLSNMHVEVQNIKSQRQETENKIVQLKEDVQNLQELQNERSQGPGSETVQERPGEGPTGSHTGQGNPGGRPSGCPAEFDYDEANKICVMLVKIRRSNTAAEEWCADLADRGGLVILDTPGKLLYVQNYLRKQGHNADVFVGGTKKFNSNTFVWANDVKVTGPWCPGEPGIRGCVSLWAGMGYCLDDSWCRSENPFVCEADLNMK